MNKDKTLNVSVKCFVTAIAVIFALMIVTYALTFIIPSGEYSRVEDSNGNLIVDTTSAFTLKEGNLTFWKWLLSPVLILGYNGSTMIIAILIFLLIIGGTFECLGKCNFLSYMLNSLTAKFGNVRYKFLAIVMLFFMLLGAMIGSFEEVVPMVPIVVALSVSLGWDKITGLAMSLLAVGCGFASGVCNPFTVGIAQRLAGVPMFSGILFRILCFICIYFLLLLVVRSHARKVDNYKTGSFVLPEFEKKPELSKALKAFGIILGLAIAIVISSSFITVLQDYTLIIFALAFLIAGITSSRIAGMTWKQIGKSAVTGAKTMLPSTIMILMASSIKYILVEGKIQDSLLHFAIEKSSSIPTWTVILFIYVVVLVMNFFVGSGSAKAFMMIPLIVPLANAFGISSNLAISAFAFGDGFSNVLYPTNAALLIALGVADINYSDWFKWSWKFQGLNLLLTSALLLFGFFIGY